ncbi:rna-directed dna polymerase from mobile element hypothetical protein [Limosa lapponica baueri]|uniref:Rna-directed dna polymerase from mobile element jockey-like n=1 Tax=Limosa lapponica baueri TaxID=1758121 RepID=A0A2I0U0Q9_LIMLA|nr:rna-directed dna polymerase from mobile element hypothetical protein [Limosa lapponica baueri]
MVMQDIEKAEVLNAFFSSKTSLQQDASEAAGKVWSKEDTPLVEEDQVRDCLSKLDVYKSMGPDGIHSHMLRNLADVIARPFSVMFAEPWQVGEVPEHWRKANVTPIFKKGKKKDLEIYRLASFTSIPGKVMGQIILGTISRHTKDKKVNGSSGCGFTKRIPSHA